MKDVTVILGKPGSGKTTLAMKMALGKKKFWTTEHFIKTHRTNSYWKMPEETEVIIVDEIFNLNQFIHDLIISDVVVIKEKSGYPKVVKRPQLILISNILRRKDFELHDCEIIEL